MAKVITQDAVQSFIKEGILHINNMRLILKGYENLPTSFYKKYMRLLCRFQICCPVDENRLLVPSKLPEKKPERLRNDDNHDLLVRYHSFAIPFGFWSRFISRLLLLLNEMLTETILLEIHAEDEPDNVSACSSKSVEDLDADNDMHVYPRINQTPKEKGIVYVNTFTPNIQERFESRGDNIQCFSSYTSHISSMSTDCNVFRSDESLLNNSYSSVSMDSGSDSHQSSDGTKSYRPDSTGKVTGLENPYSMDNFRTFELPNHEKNVTSLPNRVEQSSRNEINPNVESGDVEVSMEASSIINNVNEGTQSNSTNSEICDIFNKVYTSPEKIKNEERNSPMFDTDLNGASISEEHNLQQIPISHHDCNDKELSSDDADVLSNITSPIHSESESKSKSESEPVPNNRNNIAYFLRQNILTCWKYGIIFSHPDLYFSVQQTESPIPNRKDIETKVSNTPAGWRALGFIVDHIRTLIKEWYPGLIATDGRNPSVIQKIACPVCIKMGMEPHLFDIQNVFQRIYSCGRNNIACENSHSPQIVKVRELCPELVFADLPKTLQLTRNLLEYEVHQDNEIGAGGFGKVYRGKYR